MKEKTKQVNPWVIAALFSTIYVLVIYFAAGLTKSSWFSSNYLMALGFHIVPTGLVGLSTIESIEVFSKGVYDYGGKFYWELIISLLLMFITSLAILPFLVVKGNMDKQRNSLYWYISNVLVIAVVFITIFTYSVSIPIFQKTKAQSDVSRFHDKVRSEASVIVMESSEKMILPNDLGGGGRSFLNFKDENNQARSIELSDVYNGNDLGITFQFTEVTDSSAILVAEAGGVDKESGAPNESYIKLEIVISPLDEQKIRWLRNR